MSTTFDEANEFLLAGGVTSAKFETPGATVSGEITHYKKEQQREIDTGKPKFWEDGKPREQIVVHLQTTVRDPAVEDDDGVRALYVRGQMLKAIREAVRKAGAARLEQGAQLTVVYTGDGEQKTKGYNPPKLYRATYVPAAQAAASDTLGATTPAAPPATSQTLPPGITAEEWAQLPQAAKEALAKMHGTAPY